MPKIILLPLLIQQRGDTSMGDKGCYRFYDKRTYRSQALGSFCYFYNLVALANLFIAFCS